MYWNGESLDKMKLENVDNIEAKKKVAEKIVEKVKDGQVIRLWFGLNIFYSYNCNCGKSKE